MNSVLSFPIEQNEEATDVVVDDEVKSSVAGLLGVLQESGAGEPDGAGFGQHKLPKGVQAELLSDGAGASVTANQVASLERLLLPILVHCRHRDSRVVLIHGLHCPAPKQLRTLRSVFNVLSNDGFAGELWAQHGRCYGRSRLEV